METMNTLFRSDCRAIAVQPVAVLEYRDILRDNTLYDPNQESGGDGSPAKERAARVSLSEEELNQRLHQAAAVATQEIERRLLRENECQIETLRARIGEAIEGFERERSDYYAAVEPELVHLILAVSAKILHREAQVDRMLVAALARVAVENLQQRSHVVLKVPVDACAEWREYFSCHLSGTKVDVLEDSELQTGNCVLETELGTAEVGIEAQLKEIERGFFDLLAKRPEPRWTRRHYCPTKTGCGAVPRCAGRGGCSRCWAISSSPLAPSAR
jgi:flagellar assembly protein FliH